mmetsp:Transcript_14817/g.18317  ORF Transcript_14817/g.18317 Transcript_14817/m.18317 type:complete len:220 (+) Transcript_14817:228-887(+)|eukprot:CAMPEP_0204850304 /NCGR_PEP_ID=MMETSP1347-20130617/7908_1 /ASSEMBLY_ACC=CAM_ASM_000690 /TAXON_ID=215587 /ORGANISM="Aplanochytrium stocchinoi, Strain GSBS06" /LENGTH=219 /DNA_ID=CAMNT_0051993209 /DNA_START=222 /DNA_END=881 /DNA_ORIENTATION=+
MVLGQYFNGAALSALAKVFSKPSLLVPHYCFRTIADVDWAALKAETKTLYVVFDKDNTLTAPYVDSLYPKVAKSVEKCMEVFGNENVAIVSNSAGTKDDVGFKWKSNIEAATGICVIPHQHKKPKGFDEVLAHFNQKQVQVGPGEDASRTCAQAREILVVGDRMLTDIVFGNLHRAYTLHCTEILTEKGDNPFASVIRKIENQILKPLLHHAKVEPPLV